MCEYSRTANSEMNNEIRKFKLKVNGCSKSAQVLLHSAFIVLGCLFCVLRDSKQTLTERRPNADNLT